MILGYWLVADSHVIYLYKFTNPTLSIEHRVIVVGSLFSQYE